MKRVAQKSIESADCGIACVAMVTGNDYDTVLKIMAHHAKKDGTYYTKIADLKRAVEALGFQVSKPLKFTRFRDITGIAIVATNKRADGNWHWVVCDGTGEQPYVYDPKPLKKKKITDFRGLNGFDKYLQLEK